jgi:hypothetical protein
MTDANERPPNSTDHEEPDLRSDAEIEALTEAGGEVVGDEGGEPLIEGPNSA